ncbi:MAG: hypothetical protein LBQ31_11820 [Bacteroidales bacterium]|jgi:hypothetical protein|nr:hypothetical protein [Bacteroidales bacterium]
MRKITEIVRREIERLPKASVFSLDDIATPEIKSTNYYAFTKALTYLEKNKEIVRIRKGLYFKSYISAISDLQINMPTQNNLIAYYSKKFNNGFYLSGYSLYNDMRLTEQVAQTITMTINERLPKNFVEFGLYFAETKHSITQENKYYLQILDCIEHIDDIPEKCENEVIENLLNYHFGKLSQKDIDELVFISKSYNAKTRIILSRLLKKIGYDDSTLELIKTLSLSRQLSLQKLSNYE